MRTPDDHLGNRLGPKVTLPSGLVIQRLGKTGGFAGQVLQRHLDAQAREKHPGRGAGTTVGGIGCACTGSCGSALPVDSRMAVWNRGTTGALAC